MKDQGFDSLGRATFRTIARREDVRPTARESRWLKHIERHGPQASPYLYELTRDTHRCKDTSLRDLQKLRAGGILALPRQQRATERAEFKPYVYDLTRKGRTYLEDHALAEPTVRPTGHWWHANAVAQVTSSIDITARRRGVRYIPAHKILAIKGTDLAIPVDRSTLIPDQLFALDYGGSYRAFVLEVDRGTEPKASPAKRKSWVRSIAQYRSVLEHNLHKAHYGLKSNLLVLWVFRSKRDQQTFLSMCASLPEQVQAVILTQVCNGVAYVPQEALFLGPWRRARGCEVRIGLR